MKNVPILYVGAPGIGKTAKVLQQYDHCEILLLSSCCEEDIAGLPYRDGNKEKRTLPKFVESINKIDNKKTVCLFLDEIDKARREVSDTILTLITNPRYFGITREVDIVAAANPPEWGGGDGISQAMHSRFSVVQATIDIDCWEKWARKNYDNKGVLNCIDMILKKEIPILESNGEGYDFRLTCPRTLELAWKAMIQGKKHLVSGLLTPNAASGVILAFSKEQKQETVQNKARIIASSYLSNKSNVNLDIGKLNY